MNVFIGKVGQVIKGKGFLNLFQFLKKLQHVFEEMNNQIGRLYQEYSNVIEATQKLDQLYPLINNLQLILYKDILGTVAGMGNLYLQEIVTNNPMHGTIPYNKQKYSWLMEYFDYGTKNQTGVYLSGSDEHMFCMTHNRKNQYGMIYQVDGCMKKIASYPTSVQNLINYFGGYNDPN